MTFLHRCATNFKDPSTVFFILNLFSIVWEIYFHRLCLRFFILEIGFSIEDFSVLEFIGYLAFFLVPPLPFPLIHASYVLCALHLGCVNSIVLESGLCSSLVVLEWIVEIYFWRNVLWMASACRFLLNLVFAKLGMNETFWWMLKFIYVGNGESLWTFICLQKKMILSGTVYWAVYVLGEIWINSIAWLVWM